MRIIFLEAVHNFGGSKRSVIDMAEQLKNSGHDVLIVDFWGRNENFVKAVEDRGLNLKVLSPDNEPFVISSGSFLTKCFRFAQHYSDKISYKKTFKALASEFNADYVCVNCFKAIDILEANGKYKIDFFVRGWSIDRNIKSLFYFWKFKPRFVAISEASRQALHIQHGVSLSDIRVVKAAIASEPSIFKSILNSRLNFDKDNPINLFQAGTFAENKGHHTSLLIANELKKRGFNFKLKIAGLISSNDISKNYYKKLVKMRADLELCEEVEFIVNKNNLSDEMKKADIFLNPSFSEGLSRVCLEAMYHGKPVIGNPAGGVTDFIINDFSGYLVDYNDVDSFIKAIQRYYQNPEILDRHGINAVNIINFGYLSSSLKRDLENVYEN